MPQDYPYQAKIPLRPSLRIPFHHGAVSYSFPQLYVSFNFHNGFHLIFLPQVAKILDGQGVASKLQPHTIHACSEATLFTFHQFRRYPI